MKFPKHKKKNCSILQVLNAFEPCRFFFFYNIPWCCGIPFYNFCIILMYIITVEMVINPSTLKHHILFFFATSCLPDCIPITNSLLRKSHSRADDGVVSDTHVCSRGWWESHCVWGRRGQREDVDWAVSQSSPAQGIALIHTHAALERFVQPSQSLQE